MRDSLNMCHHYKPVHNRLMLLQIMHYTNLLNHMSPLKFHLQLHYFSLLLKYFRGEWTLERAIEMIQQNSRHYAKRQMTWFRGMERRGFTIHWLDATWTMEEKVARIEYLLNTKNN